MVDTTQSKSNNGVIALNQRDSNVKQKTIIVVGVARGGTSIVAGTLHKLGVFMGRAQSPVYEDLKLSLAYEKRSKDKLTDVIDEYNQKADVWAWKRPSSLRQLDMIAKKVRNPYFIFVFRDFVSISNRNAISMKKGFKKGLVDALNDYSKIIKFMQKTNFPSLCVSSEKAVANKEAYLQSICDFCQLEPSEGHKQAALNFITPNPVEYLAKTRIDRVHGWIDKWQLQTGILKGWAHFPRQPQKAPTIQLVVKNQIVAAVEANASIKVSLVTMQPKAAKNGFEIDLKALGIKSSDQMVLKVEGDDAPFLEESISFEHLEDWLTSSELAKLNEPKGRVEKPFFKTGVLRGWAIGRSPEKPVNVVVKVNKDVFATIPARLFRPGLKAQKIHTTGKCGFQINLKALGVQPHDIIEVAIENEKSNLHAKPITYPSMTQWLSRKEWEDRQKAKKKQREL